jgi:hypothetical protein
MVLTMVSLLVGCASTPKVDWDSRVGHYTYDQAVTELGPPDRSSPLSDGQTVAEWFLKRGSSVSFGFGTGFYGGHSGVAVGQSVSTGPSGIYLRLTFEANHTLTKWEKVKR